LAGQAIKPHGGVIGQRDLASVEAQLRRGGELVDILPAPDGGADEADLDVVLVDRKVAGNPQHGAHRGHRESVSEDSGFAPKLLVPCGCSASDKKKLSSPSARPRPAARRLAGPGRRSR